VADEKEIKYRDDSGREVTEKVDPETLDKKMNEADAVYGVEGDDKRRAAYLSQGSGDKPDEAPTGERGS
jgi:preprotein translocase subunit Sec63